MVQEFRPADVIEQDTRLAASLADGDIAALDELVNRYGRAVGAVVADGHGAATGQVVDVFVGVWGGRHDIAPGADFASWVGGLAARAAGWTSDEVDATWATAMAIDAIADDARPGLRAVHVEDGELADGADRQELRLRRRLAHLGNDESVASALRDPAPWRDPAADLAERVRTAVTASDVPHAPDTEYGPLDDRAEVEAVDRPSRVSRSLRPVLLGLAGAAVVLFVAIIALSAASGSVDPVAFTADLTPTGAILDIDGGKVTVTERDAGLEIELDAPTLPRRAGDQYYEGVLVLQDGTEVSAGTFNEGASVTLTAGVDLDRVETFNVVARVAASAGTDIVLKLDVPRS